MSFHAWQIRYRKYPPFNKDQGWFTPHNFFVQLDGVLKLYDRMPLCWLREKALHKAATWMLEHIKGSGGLGAIYPAMANSIVALRCLGYQVDDPLVRKALHEIESLEVYDTVSVGDQRVEALHLQPCHSPIWDTALLMNAFIETGMPQDHPSLQKAAAYLGFSPNENGWRLDVSRLPMRNREAGISNLRTSSIPMWMTRQWC